jgi:hypothetical protein
VFVVGAGASADFGFPTGSDLANSIRSLIDEEFQEVFGRPPDTPLRRAFANSGTEVEREAAGRSLRAGIRPGQSIDQFLFVRRTNPVVRDLGTIAIAEVILTAERNSQLSHFSIDQFETSLAAQRVTQNGWPVILMDILVGDKQPHEIDETTFQDVAFLIFNYDRCVEQLLFHHLRLTHELSEERALAVVRSIPMLHIYGVLGDPFEGPVGFGASDVELGRVAQDLQTYHEDIADTARQTAVDELMRNAEKVCFLGFGFLPANFERLFPRNEIGSRQLWGTARGCEGSPAFQAANASEGCLFANVNPTEFMRAHGEALLKAPWRV